MSKILARLKRARLKRAQCPTRRERARCERGQGMTEYIIIVALVAIAAIGVVTLFGDNIRKLFVGANEALSGETNVTITTNKSEARRFTKTRTLKTFGADNKGAKR